jgi:hypothetical protein
MFVLLELYELQRRNEFSCAPCAATSVLIGINMQPAFSLTLRESHRMDFVYFLSLLQPCRSTNLYKRPIFLNRAARHEPIRFIQRRNTMKKDLMVAALFAVLMVLPVSSRVYAQGATLTGQWQVLRDGKSETTLLTLSQSGDSITGKWAPAKGAASEIENGKIAGDTLTFSFIHDKKRFNAKGHLGGDTISFDIIGPKKWA